MSGGNLAATSVPEARTTLRQLDAVLANPQEATCQVNLVKSLALPNKENTRHLDLTEKLAREIKSQCCSNLKFAINEAARDLDGIIDFDFREAADGLLAVFPDGIDRTDRRMAPKSLCK